MENTIHENYSQFNDLVSNFSDTTYGRSESDRHNINLILDELNSLNYKVQFVKNDNGPVLLISHSCSIIPPSDTFLITKCCQLIYNLVIKQHVRVEGNSFHTALDWCIRCIKQCGNIAILDILLALHSLLRTAREIKDEHLYSLLGNDGVLILLLNGEIINKTDDLKMVSSWEIRLSTLQCLEALAINDLLKPVYLHGCAKIFLDTLFHKEDAFDDENVFCKALLASLNGLKNLIEKCPDICNGQSLGDILGAVRVYMLYGLPGFSDIKPQRVFPSHLTQADIKPNKSEGRSRKGIRIRRRSNSSRKKADIASSSGKGEDEISVDYVITSAYRAYTTSDGHTEITASNISGLSLLPTWMKSSDSEYSDSESGQMAKLNKIHSKVREVSLILLHSITKVCDKKLLFGYWTSLLPDSPSSTCSLSIVTCLLRDPAPRGRLAALNVLSNLLLGSKPYLLLAEKSSRSVTSFTPFSVTLGNMIEELHRSFCLVCETENSLPVLSHLLKCVAILVQNTPYHRISSGLIKKVVSRTCTFVKHKDTKVQVAALTILGSIVSLDPSTPEIIDTLTKVHVQKHFEDDTHSMTHSETTESEGVCDDDAGAHDVSKQMPWILRICLENLKVSIKSSVSRSKVPVTVPVEVESLQLLAVLCTNYFSAVVVKNLSDVLQILDQCLQDSDPTIRLHVGRVIEAVGKALHPHLKQTDSSAVVPITLIVDFWKHMLSGPLTSLLQDPQNGSLRSVGCNCLASIGEEAFEQLPHDKKILIVTLLFGCSKEKENYVQSSATRALAVCVLFRSLRQDIHYVIDTAEAILRALQDESLGVRIKASWSLGNLTDALIMNKNDPESEEIPDTLFLELLKYGIKAARDNDKVRSNAVRAIGNFLRLVKEEMIVQDTIKDNIKTSIQVLVENATTGSNMKVRWNACYALRNMLVTDVMYSQEFDWQSLVFPVLHDLVQNFKNFKVRINAAFALSAPRSRDNYGKYFIETWSALLNGLSKSDDMEDYNEYKHKDNLIDQICFALSYLTTLVWKEDLLPLSDILPCHANRLLRNFSTYSLRMNGEKQEVFINATKHSTYLKQLPGLLESQYRTAVLLANIFTLDTEL